MYPITLGAHSGQSGGQAEVGRRVQSTDILLQSVAPNHGNGDVRMFHAKSGDHVRHDLATQRERCIDADEMRGVIIPL